MVSDPISLSPISLSLQAEGSGYIARSFASGSAEVGLGPYGYGGSVTAYSGNAVTSNYGGGYVTKSEPTLSISPDEIKKPYFGAKGGVAWGAEIGSYSNCVVYCPKGATATPSPTTSGNRVTWKMIDETQVTAPSSGNQTLRSFSQDTSGNTGRNNSVNSGSSYSTSSNWPSYSYTNSSDYTSSSVVFKPPK